MSSFRVATLSDNLLGSERTGLLIQSLSPQHSELSTPNEVIYG